MAFDLGVRLVCLNSTNFRCSTTGNSVPVILRYVTYANGLNKSAAIRILWEFATKQQPITRSYAPLENVESHNIQNSFSREFVLVQSGVINMHP